MDGSDHTAMIATVNKQNLNKTVQVENHGNKWIILNDTDFSQIHSFMDEILEEAE